MKTPYETFKEIVEGHGGRLLTNDQTSLWDSEQYFGKIRDPFGTETEYIYLPIKGPMEIDSSFVRAVNASKQLLCVSYKNESIGGPWQYAGKIQYVEEGSLLNIYFHLPYPPKLS